MANTKRVIRIQIEHSLPLNVQRPKSHRVIGHSPKANEQKKSQGAEFSAEVREWIDEEDYTQ